MSLSQAQPKEPLRASDVLRRMALLERVSGDVVECFSQRRKAKERLEELIVISRRFSSCEIQETINTLRRQVHQYDVDMDEYEKEAQLLGGFLKDSKRGVIYFHSEREGRKVYLVWDPRAPDQVCWHELNESFADRTILDLSQDSDRPETADRLG